MTKHPILPPPPLPDFIERLLPAGTRRALVDVGGYRMHVMETGPADGRPVLMLHGNPTWGFLYRKVAAELSGEPLRVILPDLIGLGFSDRPREPREHQLENHARWLGSLLDALDLHELVFVGQDWGGPIGLTALAARPGLARGLVLLNTAVSVPRPGSKATAFHRFARLPLVSDAVFRLLAFPQSVLHRIQGDPSSIRGDVARAYRYPLRGLSRNAAPLALARMVPASANHPSVEPLRRCQAFVESWSGPAAIVWGGRDPVLGRLRHRLEKALPRAHVTSTSAGHFPQEEVPREIADAVRRVAGPRRSKPSG